MTRVGWIGAGIMGKAMGRNLMKHGFELHLYARHPQKVQDIVAEGAILHDSIASCVRACDVVITMVGFPDDVREVYMDEGGIFAHAREGQLLIDMTTSSPKLAQELAQLGREKDLRVLDAPVTGGDAGAREGTLTILIGGREEDAKAAWPLFEAMGRHIHHCGEAGCGQHMKLANQIMIAGALSGVSEAAAYIQKQGMDPQEMIDDLKAGAAGSRQLELLGPKMVRHGFAPGFFVKHFVKDMRLADAEAKEDGLQLNVLQTVLDNFEQLAEEGHADDGTQCLITRYLKY